MRHISHDEVAEAARRRLDLVRQELAAAGYRPTGGAEDAQEASREDDRALDGIFAPATLESVPAPAGAVAVDARPLADAGRHARRSVSGRDRLATGLHGVMPETLQGRISLAPAHLTVLALVAALALTIAAVIAMRSTGESAEIPPRPVMASTAPDPEVDGGTLAEPATATQDASASKGGSDQIVIDVAGKVRRPGVFTLPSGSRVIDAIKRAGGLKGRPSLDGLNRARVLVDGEQVLVGVPTPGGVAASSAASPGSASPGALISLNSATQTQLEELPGVGPVTAEKIVAWRQSHGAFSAIDELLEIDGIGDKTLAELAPHLTL